MRQDRLTGFSRLFEQRQIGEHKIDVRFWKLAFDPVTCRFAACGGAAYQDQVMPGFCQAECDPTANTSCGTGYDA
jgi:hypothetical protein